MTLIQTIILWNLIPKTLLILAHRFPNNLFLFFLHTFNFILAIENQIALPTLCTRGPMTVWNFTTEYLHGYFNLKYVMPSLPPKVKMQYVHFRSHTEYFLLSWIIPEEISRRSMLFHN